MMKTLAEISYRIARALPEVPLQPGTVYRTAWLRRWGDNPTRLAQRLEAKGLLQRLGHGLIYARRSSRFGEVPPSDEALLDAFLDRTPYLVTGPTRWNSLGLGSTALFAHPLVYNTKRTGSFELGGRTFELRRVAFPSDPSPEWFVVDLLRNVDSVGVDRDDLARCLSTRVRAGRLDAGLLFEMATRFGGPREFAVIRQATL